MSFLQLLQGGRSQIKTDIYSKLLLWKDGIRFKFSSLIFVLFLKHVSWKSRRYFLFCFWYHMSNGASRTFWYMTWGLQNTAQFNTSPIWNIWAIQYNDSNDLKIEDLIIWNICPSCVFHFCQLKFLWTGAPGI